MVPGAAGDTTAATAATAATAMAGMQLGAPSEPAPRDSNQPLRRMMVDHHRQLVAHHREGADMAPRMLPQRAGEVRTMVEQLVREQRREIEALERKGGDATS